MAPFSETADAQGFRLFRVADTGRFIDSYGAIRARVEADGRVRCRVAVGVAQSNVTGSIHGGFILAYADQVAFCAPILLGRMTPGGAVTVSAGVTFVGAATIDEPLDALVEIYGETGRMMFVRGLIEQAGDTVASFEVQLRKTPALANRIAAAT